MLKSCSQWTDYAALVYIKYHKERWSKFQMYSTSTLCTKIISLILTVVVSAVLALPEIPKEKDFFLSSPYKRKIDLPDPTLRN